MTEEYGRTSPDGETPAEVEEDKKRPVNWAGSEGAECDAQPEACPDGEALVSEMDKQRPRPGAETVQGAENVDEAALENISEPIVGSVGAEEAEQTKLDKVPGLDDWLLQKKILKEGQGQATRPDVGQEVTIKLLGVLEDGTIIDKDPKLTFVIGDGDAIQALEFCAFSMQLDEVALAVSDGQYAYGHNGRAPDVPADATLIYEVQLLNVRNAPDPKRLLVSDCIRTCKQKRERGNYHFQREDYQSAVKSYNLALDILNTSSELNPSAQEAEELQEDGLKCLNNLAAAQMKLDLHEEVIASSNALLQLDPNNVKALFRKGKLLSKQGDYEEAMETLKRALKLEPSTKAIHAELSKLVKIKTGQTGPLQQKNNTCQKPEGKAVTPLPAPHKPGLAVPWKWIFGAVAVVIGGVVTSIVMVASS
ncbi:FKBP prolyl isomerase 16 [Mustelus asterias]